MNKIYYIYRHTSPSGKVYVGQSVDLRKRWSGKGYHYKEKRKDGTYVQPLFARALNKYGWDNFIHEILLECKTKSEANYAERYLIRWYKSKGQSYNITDGGEGVLGVHVNISEKRKKQMSEYMRLHHPMKGKHHTLEAKTLISEAGKNRIYTEEQKLNIAKRMKKIREEYPMTEQTKAKLSKYKKEHPEIWVGGWNAKKVYQYDLNGNYMTTYHSAMDASIKIVGKERSGEILKCIKGEVASAFGFVWKDYRNNHIDLSNFKIITTKKGVRLVDMSPTGKKKRRIAHGKAVNQYTLDGKYITTFNSTVEASESCGIGHTSIGKCCLGKLKTAGGYLWKYNSIYNEKKNLTA